MSRIFKNKTTKLNGVINLTNKNATELSGRTRKYTLRENGRPHPKVVRQYVKIIDILKIKNEVILDFGCCMGHASFVFKERTPKATYIGADLNAANLLAGKSEYNPKFLYKVKYTEPCLDGIKDDSIDLIIVSRLTDWTEVDNFFPEFNRVLKKGGHLFVRSNGGGLRGKGGHVVLKLKVYEYLKNDYKSYRTPGRDLEGFALALWGDKNRYKNLKKEFTKKEWKKTFNGIFIKK
jgi:SAM-dependent methyltransferase